MHASVLQRFVALPFLLAASLACATFGDPQAAAIRAVIAEDAALSEQAGQEMDAGMSRQEALQKMTAGMRAIDLSACPADFREAYMAHIQAWEKAAAKYGVRIE